MIAAGGKFWFTSTDLETLALPGLPKTKRKINERAAAENWALRVDEAGAPLARPTGRRGGGLEYHLSLLPASAKAELVRRGIAFVPANDEDAPIGAARLAHDWGWYEGQSDKVKAEAMRRAAVIASVETFQATGLGRTAAVEAASAAGTDKVSTIYGYLRLIKGVDAIDRLPALAPRRKGGGKEAEVDDGAWQFFKSDYLRPEEPTLSSCHWRTLHRYCLPRGIAWPCEKTIARKVVRDIDPRLVIAMRKGKDVMKAMVPAQKRSVGHLHAMAIVNIDGHMFDVRVNFGKDARGNDVIERPIMVGIQDVYSKKMLAWRIGDTESALLTRLAFADLFKRWGIPGHCVMDNGRAFASKWISGGVKTRFRFTIRKEDPVGLLPSLGIGITWTLPYSGQSKPIERAWKDFADRISRGPECAGAYTGNHIDAKPENYGERAIPIDEFLKIVDQGIADHNARTGRRGETARGASFDAVFADSYARMPIGKASEEHLRLALLTGEQLRADRKSGAVKIAENSYWSPELSRHAGELLTVRFDPDDLSLPIHIYNLAGHYLCSAERWEASLFDDMGAAKRTARLRKDIRKAVRHERDLQDLLTAEQLVALSRNAAVETAIPEPAVIRPTRHRGQTAAALKPVSVVSQRPVMTPEEAKFAQMQHRAALRLIEN